MPYNKFYAVSKPSLNEGDRLTGQFRSFLGLLKLKLRQPVSTSTIDSDDLVEEIRDSDSWVFISHQTLIQATETPTKPVLRAGPNTPRRNRRSVKTQSHVWSSRQLAHVLPEPTVLFVSTFYL